VIHELALDLSAAFGDLSNHMEFGGYLPEEWKDAYRACY
jgi:hypothetical protein